jgi:hypothetical protein
VALDAQILGYHHITLNRTHVACGFTLTADLAKHNTLSRPTLIEQRADRMLERISGRENLSRLIHDYRNLD